MKYLFTFCLLITLLAACVPANTKATWPPGATLCNKDPDCFEGQHCGFVWGYTAAVCKGAARSDRHNLR